MFLVGLIGQGLTEQLTILIAKTYLAKIVTEKTRGTIYSLCGIVAGLAGIVMNYVELDAYSNIGKDVPWIIAIGIHAGFSLFILGFGLAGKLL